MSIGRCLVLSFLMLAPVVARADDDDARSGYVDRFEIVSTYDAYGGASFGNVGPYQVIVAIAHGKLDPSHPANAGIVDLNLAPHDKNGLVDYSTDVVILRPKSAANAKRVLFYDVVNRGNKVVLGTFDGGSGANFNAGSQGNALLLRMGYTIVWSGWQGNLPQSGQGDTKPIGVNFPTATNPDRSSITGQTREEFILDSLDASSGPGLKNGVATVTLTYPAATLDQSNVVFNWRQTWKTADGETFDSPSTPVPAASWTYVNGGKQIQFTPPAGSDLGSIFTFIYPAKDPKPMAIGFAGVRDLITFLNRANKDHQGNSNPLNDIQFAPCEAQHCNRSSNFEVTIIEGVSQSGRFTRDFLWQGFNHDGRGDGDADDGGAAHTVFNGMFPIIPASRKTYTNFRWSQPFRWSKQHEDHLQPGDQFPFAYNVITDPVSGKTDGILNRCLQSNTCPKIVQLDGGFEYYGGRGTLVSTDGKGHDLTLPDNVRLYMVPGTNHGGGAGVAAPSTTPNCKYETSVVMESTIDRALVPVLEDWVGKGVAPPASAYPSDGMLAPINDQSAIGFPDLSGIGYPYPADTYNQLFVTDYSQAEPSVDLSKPYEVMVSKTDSDGNELAGVRVPEVVVPLATYADWNVRTTNHTPGEGCGSLGTTIPFARTKAQRMTNGDPRPSFEERYSSQQDYVSKVQAAAQALVAQRLLLQEDVQVYVTQAQSQKVVQ
ncbi:MAG: alpha/beta hydrolase domain-containing protein [Myxococcales bacterium]